MVALGLRVVGALFAAFEPQIPRRRRSVRPLGCHRRRIAGRDVFEAVVFRLVTGCSWDVAGRLGRRGEATLRNRYNEWNADGAFDRLAAEAVGGYDRIVGVDLAEASVDASIHKAPCGGEGAGKALLSGADRAGSGRCSQTDLASRSAGPPTAPTATTPHCWSPPRPRRPAGCSQTSRPRT